MTESYDALVIGGGPGGATSALLLARAGWSVLLVERKPFPRRKVCGEYLSATNLPVLASLGLAEQFAARAGPPVRQVGLYAGERLLTADLPRPSKGGWGRALGRDHLDVLLLDEACRAGVRVRQPCTVRGLRRVGGQFQCNLQSEQEEEVTAGIIVAAHGSWDPGMLPTQPPRRAVAASDLFGFKAHFTHANLPAGLMPLLVFPGGYGGMVHADSGRVSLSCCVRRDRLVRLRKGFAVAAGVAVVEHIRESCLGVRRALEPALLDGPWLAAGPIRPGIRLHGPPGIFPVGNAAGEAHPVIAEGISMALQSAWLLAELLVPWRQAGSPADRLPALGRAYARGWRRAFASRLHVARAVAETVLQPAAVQGLLPLFELFPELLHWGARLSGKASMVAAL